MKKYLFIFLLVFSILVSAQYRQDLNKYRERVAISVKAKTDITRLVNAAIDIDYCSVYDGVTVYAYATPDEQMLIRYLGFSLKPAPVVIGQNSRANAYHTHDTLTTELQELAKKYPKIAMLKSIGKSVQGRELWIMKISDNVTQDEPEVEVKYVSTMHGDEVVGKELMIYLIRLILEKYGKDPVYTELVNNAELWIMPNMNPDGTAAHRRYNANWVDLNRNFPDPQKEPNNNTPTGRAIETQHMMKFTAERNFAISINFHGGAVCVNYPWDTMSGQVADIDLTKYLSLGYSKRNQPMYKSSHFSQGITNGYEWYEVNGGMQDWNYFWHNDLEITLELSARKWPDADTLPGYWDDNRDSLVWFLRQSLRNVNGIVTDAKTGAPIAAKVEVLEIDKPIYCSQKNGDYHRVLLPGTYSFKFSAPGYKDTVINDVVVTAEEKATVVNVKLNSK